MIDVHCHVLPGTDDGAVSNDDALAMLRIAANDGIDRIVATPHVPPITGTALSPEEILRRVHALNALARDHGIPVEILTGSEIRCELDVCEALQTGELLTLNGSPYVLLELPLVGEWPVHARSTIYDLQMAGFVPVLAHVERYPSVQRDLQPIVDLISTGVIMQVNAASVLAGNGDRAGATAARLLEARMVHLLATDAHSQHSRPPRLRAAYQRAAELTDGVYAGWLEQAAEAVVTGEQMTLPEPELAESRSWWGRVWPRSNR